MSYPEYSILQRGGLAFFSGRSAAVRRERRSGARGRQRRLRTPASLGAPTGLAPSTAPSRGREPWAVNALPRAHAYFAGDTPHIINTGGGGPRFVRVAPPPAASRASQNLSNIWVTGGVRVLSFCTAILGPYRDSPYNRINENGINTNPLWYFGPGYRTSRSSASTPCSSPSLRCTWVRPCNVAPLNFLGARRNHYIDHRRSGGGLPRNYQGLNAFTGTGRALRCTASQLR